VAGAGGTLPDGRVSEICAGGADLDELAIERCGGEKGLLFALWGV